MNCAICSKYGGAFARPGEHHRKGCAPLAGSSSNAGQVQDLLRRARPSREHHDAVRQAHEGLEALFDVRHDDELAYDRVRRLGAR